MGFDMESIYSCPDCGEMLMQSRNGRLKCPNCGFSACINEFENDYDTYNFGNGADDEMDIPEGCLACGGPYPDCTSSCSIFDD